MASTPCNDAGFIAHVRPDGKGGWHTHSLKHHLESVAQRVEQNAQKIRINPHVSLCDSGGFAFERVLFRTTLSVAARVAMNQAEQRQSAALDPHPRL